MMMGVENVSETLSGLSGDRNVYEMANFFKFFEQKYFPGARVGQACKITGIILYNFGVKMCMDMIGSKTLSSGFQSEVEVEVQI